MSAKKWCRNEFCASKKKLLRLQQPHFLSLLLSALCGQPLLVEFSLFPDDEEAGYDDDDAAYDLQPGNGFMKDDCSEKCGADRHEVRVECGGRGAQLLQTIDHDEEADARVDDAHPDDTPCDERCEFRKRRHAVPGQGRAKAKRAQQLRA